MKDVDVLVRMTAQQRAAGEQLKQKLSDLGFAATCWVDSPQQRDTTFLALLRSAYSCAMVCESETDAAKRVAAAAPSAQQAGCRVFPVIVPSTSYHASPEAATAPKVRAVLLTDFDDPAAISAVVARVRGIETGTETWSIGTLASVHSLLATRSRRASSTPSAPPSAEHNAVLNPRTQEATADTWFTELLRPRALDSDRTLSPAARAGLSKLLTQVRTSAKPSPQNRSFLRQMLVRIQTWMSAISGTDLRAPRPGPREWSYLSIASACIVAVATMAIVKHDAIWSLVQALASGYAADWWQHNVYFASATEIGGAVLVMTGLARWRRRDPEVHDAALRYVGSAAVYYAALLVSDKDGPLSVGRNNVLEVVNLYLGFSAYTLARTLDPVRARTTVREIWPLLAMVGITVAVFSTPSTELKTITAFCTSPYVFLCGLRLTWAARHSRWSSILLGAYTLGLLTRPLFVLHGTELMSELFSFDSWVGLVYYALMACKFAFFGVAARAMVASRQRSHRDSPQAALGSAYEATQRL